MQREYEEFKIRINALVSMAQKVPEEGWTMQDGTPWPGNNVRDHPGMIQVRGDFFLRVHSWIFVPEQHASCWTFYILRFETLKDFFLYFCLAQVFLGHNGVRDVEGNELPRLVYVSREKRPGFDHHKKAGAMNALVELSLSLSFFFFGIPFFVFPFPDWGILF